MNQHVKSRYVHIYDLTYIYTYYIYIYTHITMASESRLGLPSATRQRTRHRVLLAPSRSDRSGPTAVQAWGESNRKIRGCQGVYTSRTTYTNMYIPVCVYVYILHIYVYIHI